MELWSVVRDGVVGIVKGIEKNIIRLQWKEEAAWARM